MSVQRPSFRNQARSYVEVRGGGCLLVSREVVRPLAVWKKMEKEMTGNRKVRKRAGNRNVI